MHRAAPLFAALLLASACATTNVPGTSVKECHANADCGSGQSCLFAAYDSCGEPGVCAAAPDGSACIEQTACACNGATVTVCLVNGNSPSPVSALGSCDGATQQGFDANVPAIDSAPPSGTDASESSVPVTPEDSGGTPDDSGDLADGNDAANTTLLGMPCSGSSSTQCDSDPVYYECKRVAGTYICTNTCPSGQDSECQPPANGVCNTSGSTYYCALN